MTVLKRGSRGRDVRELQISLKAVGHDPGDADGIFGTMTEEAVISFQQEYEELTVDGIAGPQTFGALAAALTIKDQDMPEPPPCPPADTKLSCSDAIWDGFNAMVATIIGLPVKYGPGRGLFVDGEFVVTYGPGKLDYKDWKTKTPPPYPSFHCSSWTNFFLGWVSGRNGLYTHSGNIPSLFNLCEQSPDLHENNGLAEYRGHNDVCQIFRSNGASRPRSGIGDSRVMDLLEIWDRRAEMPTFFVCGQSSKKSNGSYKWWHHTVLFVVDHRQEGSPLYRIAADGYKGSGGAYSGTAMHYNHMTKTHCCGDVSKHVYRGYNVYPPEGLTPAPVVIEE